MIAIHVFFDIVAGFGFILVGAYLSMIASKMHIGQLCVWLASIMTSAGFFTFFVPNDRGEIVPWQFGAAILLVGVALTLYCIRYLAPFNWTSIKTFGLGFLAMGASAVLQFLDNHFKFSALITRLDEIIFWSIVVLFGIVGPAALIYRRYRAGTR